MLSRVLFYTAGFLALVNIYALFQDIHLHKYADPDVHSFDQLGTGDDAVKTTGAHLASGDHGNDAAADGDTLWYTRDDAESVVPNSRADQGADGDASDVPENATETGDAGGDWWWWLIQVFFEVFDELIPVLFMLVVMGVGAINNLVRQNH